MNNREIKIGHEIEREITPRVRRWLRSIEARCWEMTGCSVSDLPDRDWSALYDDGLTPREAIQRAMDDAS